MASKLATLKSMTAAANARLAPTTATVPAPTTNANDVALTDGSTVANVQNDSAPAVKTPVAPVATKSSGPITVPGFTIKWHKGAELTDDMVKATVTRSTTNPWYDVVCVVSKQTAGYLTITRDADSKAKAPTSQIWSAILRAQKLDVKGSRKLTVKSGKEAGVWYLVHVA